MFINRWMIYGFLLDILNPFQHQILKVQRRKKRNPPALTNPQDRNKNNVTNSNRKNLLSAGHQVHGEIFTLFAFLSGPGGTGLPASSHPFKEGVWELELLPGNSNFRLEEFSCNWPGCASQKHTLDLTILRSRGPFGENLSPVLWVHVQLLICEEGCFFFPFLVLNYSASVAEIALFHKSGL